MSDNTAQVTPTPQTNEQPTTPVAETPAAPQEADSTRFAALARKEKYLREQQQAFKAERERLEAEKAQLSQYAQQVTQFQQLVRENPLKALEQIGWDYTKATDYYMNNGSPSAEEQIKQLRQEQAYRDQVYQQQLQQQQEATQRAQQEEEERIISEFQDEISQFTTEKKDTYELINLYNQQGLVFEVIDTHYNNTGKVLSITEASDLVEKYLEGEAEKALQTAKLKAKVSPPVPQEEQAPQGDLKRAIEELRPSGQFVSKSNSRTLTNSAPATQAPKKEWKSDHERIQEAINKFRAGGFR